MLQKKIKTNKMKTFKVLFIAGLTALQMNVQAQDCNSNAKENFGSDEPECRKNISLYSEYLKQGNYPDAIKYWRAAMKVCPSFKPSLYTNGQIMYKSFIDAEKDETKKEALIDTLLSLYDEQIKLFGNCPEYFESKGAAALKYRQKKSEISYDAYSKYIDLKGCDATPSAIYGYYTSLYLRYRAKAVDCNKMVDDYIKLSDCLDKSCAATPDDQTCKLARETMDKYAAGCLGCDKLIEIYTKKFDALPADKDAAIKELTKMSDMLGKKECKGDLVDKIAEKLYELDPNHKAAYALALSNYGKGKYSEALKWIKQAIEGCGECEEAIKYKSLAATVAQAAGSCSSAMSYARDVIAKDATGTYKCDAYIVLARCIAASSYGENEFQRKWVYCLALDYLDKAKANGCSVGGLYANYQASCPSKNDAFIYGMEAGDPITVLGESTKLRSGW